VRKHFTDVAGSGPDADAVTYSDTHADANPDADADTNPDAHTNAESGRLRLNHHHHTESGALDGRSRRGM
jgi:hypothetical protein